MNRGYFYAYSKPNKKDLGGFGGSAGCVAQPSMVRMLTATAQGTTSLAQTSSTPFMGPNEAVYKVSSVHPAVNQIE